MASKTLITLEDIKSTIDLVQGLIYFNEVDKSLQKTLNKVISKLYELDKNNSLTPDSIIEDQELIDLIHQLQIEYLKQKKEDIKI